MLYACKLAGIHITVLYIYISMYTWPMNVEFGTRALDPQRNFDPMYKGDSKGCFADIWDRLMLLLDHKLDKQIRLFTYRTSPIDVTIHAVVCIS